MSKIFNNTTDCVVDDLKATLKQGDKVAVASACFSIYAFQALKDQLKGVNELRHLSDSETALILAESVAR